MLIHTFVLPAWVVSLVGFVEESEVGCVGGLDAGLSADAGSGDGDPMRHVLLAEIHAPPHGMPFLQRFCPSAVEGSETADSTYMTIAVAVWRDRRTLQPQIHWLTYDRMLSRSRFAL
jgi:hypothetical protein